MPITHSDQIEKLAEALSKAQGKMDDASKDSLNPHFKSAYSDLASVRAAVRAPLSENGLSYVQFPEAEGNRVSCETMLMHDSGQWMRGTLTMIAAQATPQGVGSTITYCRRYSLMAVLGIAPSEDDDGNEASRKPNGNSPVPVQQTAQVTSGIPKEPAVSSLAIKIERELKACKTVPDFESYQKQPEFKDAWNSFNPTDRSHLVAVLGKHRVAIEHNDMRMAG